MTLSTQASSPTVHVGDVFTITVTGKVSGGAAADGVIAYDIDLFPFDKTHLQFVGLASQPGTSSLSSGTLNASSGGIQGISGVFDAPGVGVGSAATLFTVQVKALAAGNGSVSAGLSVFPNSVGVPFQLSVSGNYMASGSPTFTVDSSGAIAAVSITAVPEPSALSLTAAGLVALLQRRRIAAAG